jgi:hypothetical protein
VSEVLPLEGRPIGMSRNMWRGPSEDVLPDRQAVAALGEEVKRGLIMCTAEHADFLVWPTSARVMRRSAVHSRLGKASQGNSLHFGGAHTLQISFSMGVRLVN